MAKINILALGGLDEKQRRLYILEIESKIFILDSGVYEPLNNDFGIQHFIPNYDYLNLNRDKIKAVFLSSANRMNIGSLSQIVSIKSDVEIYGSKTTIDSLGVFFGEQIVNWNTIVYEKGETKNISGIDVKAMNMASIIPGTYGYQFKTEDGNILYFTDYIFDSIKEYSVSPISELSELNNEKNLLLITDSSLSTEKVALSSKFRIRDLVKKYFNKEARLVTAIYEDEIINVVELIRLAKENKRKIFFKSKTLFKLINIMMSNGDIEEFPIRMFDEYKKEDANKSVIILSGTRTKLYKTIDILIEENNMDDFSFEAEDIVIFSALPQAGNEHVFADVSNRITIIDPIVVSLNKEDKKLFGTTEFDIRNMINLLNPEHVMPVSSYFTQMDMVKKIATENNVNPKKVILGDNGEIFTINKGTYEGITQKIKEIAPKVVEEIGDISIDNNLIEERKSIGKDGVTTISFIYNKDKLAISSDIDIQMKGVVISRGQEKMIENIKELIIRTSDELSETNQHIKKGIPSIKKTLSKIFREGIKKVPTITFNIIESE